MNGDNIYNVRREASTVFRSKKGDVWKTMLMGSKERARRKVLVTSPEA
jgi:hypothetical protein